MADAPITSGSNMIERVARAIAHATSLQSDSGVYPKWSDFRDEARAAIAAMRDGTREMYEAGAGGQGSRSTSEWESAKSSAANAYLRMINAALAEDPTDA